MDLYEIVLIAVVVTLIYSTWRNVLVDDDEENSMKVAGFTGYAGTDNLLPIMPKGESYPYAYTVGDKVYICSDDPAIEEELKGLNGKTLKFKELILGEVVSVVGEVYAVKVQRQLWEYPPRGGINPELVDKTNIYCVGVEHLMPYVEPKPKRGRPRKVAV